MIANICNYLYQIIMGRLLPFNEYGALNALFSLITIISVPGTAITLVVSKYITEYSATKEAFKIGFFLRKTLFYISVFTLILTTAFLALSPLIKWFLNIDKLSSVILLVFTIATVFILPISVGTFQGLMQFWRLGIVNVVSPIVRLILGIILVLIGYKLEGAIGALLIGNLAAIAYGFWAIRKRFITNGQKDVALGRSKAFRYGVPIFIVTLCMTLLTNIDMIMIKHYFSSYESGVYGAAVIFGRAIFYFPYAIVMAMFPLVTEANVLNNDVYMSLRKALLYSSVLCGAGVAGIFVFPELITKIFFGSRFLPALPYIKLMCLAMFPLCLLNVVANFNLAVGKAKISVWSMILGSISEIVLITIYHQTIYQVLYILFGVGTVLIIINILDVLLRKKENIYEANGNELANF